jgi:predicted O-methyltransferase YrrM
MSTLTTAPLADLLETLLQEDTASEENFTKLPYSIEDMENLMQSKTGYLDFYEQLKELPLAVSRETGSLLYMLARSCHAREIVEFGTSFGISTLFLAAALRDNGGGHLITSELEPSKVAKAKRNLATGGLSDLVDIRAGDALQTLSVDLPETVNLLLLDGAKSLYTEILALVENRLKPGSLVVADDAEFNPNYLAHVRAPGNGYMSIPIACGVELSMRMN